MDESQERHEQETTMKTDEQLQTDVLTELRWDPRVHGNEIGVIAKDGAITLTGIVHTYSEKLSAERAAKRVKGVRAIAEDIEVKMPADSRTTDAGIAEQIAQILRWNSTFRDTDIQAEVRNGYVTMTGEVNWSYERQAAANRIEELQGIAGIFNHIKIREQAPSVAPRDVQRQITGALHRHANIEASKVRVSVAEGKVTLDGTIDTFCERDLIEDAVWATAGVKQVEDNLTVA
jgi:osmotically-inducible protein OsmY